MYKIRKANTEEQFIILELVGKVLADYDLAVNTKSTDKDITDLNQHYFDNNGWFAVLEQNEKIIGTYGIYRTDNNVCELRKMYLLKEYQGLGLGKIMLDDALEVAKKLGYNKMILETNKVLQKAMQLYKKYGFIEYHPSHLSDRCDFAMLKKL